MRQMHNSNSNSNNNNKNRLRSRNRKVGGQLANKVYESMGPEGKVRGLPQQIIEKYHLLSRDANTAGDRVMAENYAQHAEHYVRLLVSSSDNKEIETKDQKLPAKENEHSSVNSDYYVPDNSDAESSFYLVDTDESEDGQSMLDNSLTPEIKHFDKKTNSRSKRFSESERQKSEKVEKPAPSEESAEPENSSSPDEASTDQAEQKNAPKNSKDTELEQQQKKPLPTKTRKPRAARVTSSDTKPQETTEEISTG